MRTLTASPAQLERWARECDALAPEGGGDALAGYAPAMGPLEWYCRTRGEGDDHWSEKEILVGVGSPERAASAVARDYARTHCLPLANWDTCSVDVELQEVAPDTPVRRYHVIVDLSPHVRSCAPIDT